MIDRIEVIQKIVNRIKGQRYLEIGIKFGDTFLKVRSRYKTAIDPNYIIPWRKLYNSFFDYPWNILNHYHRIPSDEYFNKYKSRLERIGINVAFVDGLHTFEQSLKDVNNVLDILSPGGVIVLHDCNPSNPHAALPAKSAESAKIKRESTGVSEWCGDVWKTIVHLRSVRQDLSVYVLDCDFGLGVISRGQPENMLPFSIEEIKKMTFRDLEADKNFLLNLKKPTEFDHLLRGLNPFQ